MIETKKKEKKQARNIIQPMAKTIQPTVKKA